jgi:hypothetical protein
MDSFRTLTAARNRNEARSWWNRVVQQYSQISLTNEDNKPIAISALARRYQEVIGDQSVAGLWRTDLERQLLWVDSDPENSARASLATHDLRPTKYITPTWLWASLCRPVRMTRLYLGHNRSELLISILDVKVVALSKDLFGQVTFTSIRIQCHQLRRAATVRDVEDVGNILRHIPYSRT